MGVNPRSLQGQNVARFLADLSITEGLSYNTILLHRAAITTFCAGGPASDASTDFLVRQTLKAISIAKPREIKSPIWDARILLNWLAKPTDTLSLFEISRRTATLLLLASGRRNHDLTLLRMSKDYLENREDDIVMWPTFGSKTDRVSFRQSGWRISKHPNIWLCPITWIRTKLKRAQERRKDFNVDALFITIYGDVKPASRTVIPNWIRSVLKKAGIDASPGSIRSGIASRSWLDDLPVQDILDRGNWRCSETFKKHYYREVSNDNQLDPSLSFPKFTPI
ncbi:uncharacterized protein LOC117169871 [Belonocnema kinseyi]|uniref:uncharacterized protein LOC117169871 n=1 Tax=Belonocnema kinseyi TaxID=2817044 RepID=UPI00143D7011|nr:uncharacterized protein LOC117169871 [Belonocnema kinseyi]